VLPDASSILATSTISKKNGAALAPFFVAFAGPVGCRPEATRLRTALPQSEGGKDDHHTCINENPANHPAVPVRAGHGLVSRQSLAGDASDFRE